MKKLLLLAAISLGACGPERLVTAPQIELEERIRTSFSSIEVREVSLPTYAAAEEVPINDGGSLVLSEVLWADDPIRSVTLTLTRNISELTGVRVASEPWPFDEFPAARVDVRVEDLIVTGGSLRLAGQYYVADLEGGGREHAHLFEFSTPVAGGSAASIAAGRAELIAELAKDIARRGL